jgi:phosphinothricin acetyltransferase
MLIRDALAADLSSIVEIYNSSIPSRMATADLNFVSVESRLDWFAAHNFYQHPIWVMERENEVIGWLSFQSFYGRAAYQYTAELSIYVAPDYQRQGIGKKLLSRAIAQSPNLQINTLLGFIFAHNLPSLNLFTQYQFSQWGYLPKVALLDGIERDLVIVGRRVNC